MSSINDLINKSKGSTNETTKSTSAIIKPAIKKPNAIIKPSKLRLKLGIKNVQPKTPDEKPKTALFPAKSIKSPFDELADVLSDEPETKSDSISSILGDLSNEAPVSSQKINAETAQNQNEVHNSIQQDKLRSPTLDDLSKFVFAEQPDNSTEEIAVKFSNMLNSLGTAIGSDIPTVLAETLLFMKEHAFLAAILKPEEIGTLVQTMARSYGYVAGNQTQKSVKKKAKAKEQNLILNSLDGLSF